MCHRAKGQHWQAHSDAGDHVFRQQPLPGKTCPTPIILSDKQQFSQKITGLPYFLQLGFGLVLVLLGSLQTPCSACPRRPGISGSLLGLHLWPCQPALDEVQWYQHHWVNMGGAGARLIWGHDQCKRLLPDVHWWQASPPYHRCASVRV